MRTEILILFLFFSLKIVAQEVSLPEHLSEAKATISEEESVQKNEKKVTIKVMDMKTMDKVPFFSVDFTSCGHPVYESDEHGEFTMQTVEGFACYVRIGKRGYSNLDLLIDYDEINSPEKTYSIFLSRSPNYFTGTVTDSIKQNLYLDKAQIELTAGDDSWKQRVESSRQGEYSLYLKPETQYKLEIFRDGYKQYSRTFATGEEIQRDILSTIRLQPLRNYALREGLGTEVSVSRKQKTEGSLNYFSIQILANRATEIDLPLYQRELGQFGDVFLEAHGQIAKLKVGKYFDRSVAEQILKKIKSTEKYADAFLTQYIPNREVSSDIVAGFDETYMVRLASYLNPDLFDSTRVAGLGMLKKIHKDEWTIMVLDGYKELDEAKRASASAKESGFNSAHVVIMKDGQIRKVK